MDKEIQELKDKNQSLELQIQQLEIKLKTYTNHKSKKKCYDTHRERILEEKRKKYQEDKVRREKEENKDCV